MTTSHVLLRGEDNKHLIGDGFKTFKKVPAAYLVAHWLSVLLGLAGLAWLFLAGLIALLRYRTAMLRRVQAPAFLAIVLLLVPLPLFMAQSFLALGDFTLASALLALATLLLPAGMLLTIVRVVNMPGTPWAAVAHGLAAIFVLQWCAVLALAGMLPLRLWA